MKLALGTVQFGLPYGVANRSGRPADGWITEILRLALAAGVEIIDTASLYGDAEAALGRCMPQGHCFRIVTKTPKFAGLSGPQAAALLGSAFEQSCLRLGSRNLYGLLTHDADDLLGPAGRFIWQAMVELRSAGRVTRIGSSVYTGAQIDALLKRIEPDLIQLPLSLLDQRLIAGGQLEYLAQRGIEVHARSAFLQGALLLLDSELPAHLSALRPLVSQIAMRAERLGLTRVEAALRYVANLPQVSSVVCGVNSPGQFEELLTALRVGYPAFSPADAAACACTDPLLLDPSQWRAA
jgi:aryl-alcohol dehydrogenase-like predicted oxidoreductase